MSGSLCLSVCLSVSLSGSRWAILSITCTERRPTLVGRALQAARGSQSPLLRGPVLPRTHAHRGSSLHHSSCAAATAGQCTGRSRNAAAHTYTARMREPTCDFHDEAAGLAFQVSLRGQGPHLVQAIVARRQHDLALTLTLATLTRFRILHDNSQQSIGVSVQQQAGRRPRPQPRCNPDRPGVRQVRGFPREHRLSLLTVARGRSSDGILPTSTGLAVAVGPGLGLGRGEEAAVGGLAASLGEPQRVAGGVLLVVLFVLLAAVAGIVCTRSTAGDTAAAAAALQRRLRLLLV